MAENGKKSIDERLEALTMNLELLWHETEARGKAMDLRMDKIMQAIDKLVTVTNQDATAIRTLARIAEAHEARIAGLEGK